MGRGFYCVGQVCEDLFSSQGDLSPLYEETIPEDDYALSEDDWELSPGSSRGSRNSNVSPAGKRYQGGLRSPSRSPSSGGGTDLVDEAPEPHPEP